MKNFDQTYQSVMKLSTSSHIQVWQTTKGNRQNQKSDTLYGSFNLGLHIQDNPQAVHQNRIHLLASIQVKYPHIQQIHWLDQVHGNNVINIDKSLIGTLALSADAHITTDKTIALAIMTADCVPVMVSTENGEIIAGIHAGWQGLAKGVIVNTITAMQEKPSQKPKLPNYNPEKWQAWIGACIARDHYEVDEKVRTQVLAQIEKQLADKNQTLSEMKKQQLFTPNLDKLGHYLADLSAITKFQLELCGLKAGNIHLSALDSYSDEQFYSYRQQTEQGLAFTGRMATLIFKT